MVNTNEKIENIELSTLSHTKNSSEQRLENALNYIETFLTEQNNQLKAQNSLQNKDVVLANLDILISNMQDILQQFDNAE